MKTSHIFWGVFFIAFGGLLLIGNLTDLNFIWHSAFEYWPIILVLIGISIILKNQIGKGVVAGLAALFLSIILYAGISSISNFVDDDFEINFGDEVAVFDTTYFSQEFSDSILTATLNFSGGAGGFKMLTATDKLLDFRTEGVKENFRLERNDLGSHSEINFEMKNNHIKLGNNNYKNAVELSLNPKPEWELNFDVGAASVDLDLTPYKVSKIDIDMGAAALNIKLGDLSDVTRFKIDAGASDIDILIPDSVGCEINSGDALSSKNYEGFKRLTHDIYRTDNFDTATKKIYIDIECGVSSIDVKKY